MKINNKQKHYADSLTTPKEIFEQCQKIWGVKCTLDVCATKKNKKCVKFIDMKKDFLKQFNFSSKDVLWGNFPHSQNKEFVKHAYHIWRRNNCRFVILIPVNTLCSNYAAKYLLPYVEISKKIFLTGRIKFLDPKTLKPSKYNSVNGYVTLFFDQRIKKNGN